VPRLSSYRYRGGRLEGVSGLISGIELSMAAHRVTVYEANDHSDGRILMHRVTDKRFHYSVARRAPILK
jgi:predicted NAD/FAD-binding protein